MSDTQYVQFGSFTLKTVPNSDKQDYKGPKKRGSFKATRNIKAGEWVSISEWHNQVEADDGKAVTVRNYTESVKV
tara:strand:- start:545 stop:769 length:225 start_codon:yes stop_codon:yes gene_type:complete